MADRAGHVFEFIRVVAGIYLVLLGVQKILGRNAPSTGKTALAENKALWRHYVVGFATSMGNPKAILFFGTLFATALPPSASTSLRLSGAALVIVSSIAIHAGLASVLSIDSVRRRYLQARRVVDPIFGVIFVGFGVKLITTDS